MQQHKVVQRLVALLLSGSFILSPIFVYAQVTDPIVTRDSVGWGEGYQWRWNTQDYLNPPHTWTDCPSGYALTHVYVSAYNTKNKNISDIKCTKVDGLTGPVIVQELDHFEITRRQAIIGNNPTLNCNESVEELVKHANATEIVFCKNELTQIIRCDILGGIQLPMVDCPVQKQQFDLYEAQGLNTCPKGWFITGLLKRRDKTVDKNITAIKCQRVQGEVEWKASTHGLPDNTWVECPGGSAATSLLTINHGLYKDKTDAAKLLRDNLNFLEESGDILTNALISAGVPDIINLSGLVPVDIIASVLPEQFSFVGPLIAQQLKAFPLAGFIVGMFLDYGLPALTEGGDNRNWTERGMFCVNLPKPSNDKTPPAVSFLQPTIGSTFSTSNNSVRIVVTATDNLGYNNISYPFAWVSEQLRTAGKMSCIYGACTATVNLVPGQNRIMVFAKDKPGNIGSASIVVTQGAVPTPVLTINPSTPVQPGGSITLNISGASANSLIETRLSNRGRTAWYAWSPQGNTNASGSGSVGPLSIPTNVALGTYYAQARVVGIKSQQVSYMIARLERPGGGPSCQVSVRAQTGTKRALNITFSGTALPNGFGVGAWKEPCSPVVGSPSTCVNTARWDGQMTGSGNNRTVTIDATKYSSAYSGNIYGTYKANVYIWGSNPSGSDNVLCASGVPFSINRPTTVSDSKTNLAETLQGLRAALQSLRDLLESARR